MLSNQVGLINYIRLKMYEKYRILPLTYFTIVFKDLLLKSFKMKPEVTYFKYGLCTKDRELQLMELPRLKP